MSRCRRRGLWLGGGGLLAALLWLIWRPAVEVLAKPQVVARAPLPTRPTAAPVAVAPVAPVSASAPSVATSAEDPETIEVCGLGRFGPDFEAALEALKSWTGWSERQQKILLGQTLARMRSSEGPAWQHALALVLQGEQSAAVRLALHSEDPQVYVTAMDGCAVMSLPGRPAPDAGATAACGQLNARRWAQLEPGNIRPWLALAQEAQQQGDRGGFEEALYRASLAERADTGWGRITAAVRESIPAEADPVVRSMVLFEAVGWDAARNLSGGYGAVSQACRGQALQDSNRRQVCTRLSRLLMSEGRTLIDASVGVGIGERLALPREQMPLSREQLNALTAQGQELTSRPREILSCASMRKMEDWFGDVGKYGERGALERRLKQQQQSQQQQRATAS